MKKLLIIFILLFLFVFFFLKQINIFLSLFSDVGNQGVSKLGLHEVKDVLLSGSANRLDYQSIDTNTHKLYISHLGSNRIHVFDLTTQKVIKDIVLSGSPYGILAVPSLKDVYVGVGGSNQVAVIDENSLKVTKYIQAGDTPDGLAYNSQTK